MKKILIVCAGGMSSSMVAKKAQQKFQRDQMDISVSARGASEGKKLLKTQKYDLCLVSPQAKNHMKEFEALGKESQRKVIAVPSPSLMAVPDGTEEMCSLILSEME
ncbi:MAG: PTS cellobiose transporter subunit IIB [Erysipelotrichaceae bacterium]|nr:PTS cellobiose transporter subunit IIB [Erysipelotrichaceae bacterium]